VPYVLNFLYLLLILVASPWLVWRAIFTGRYREGHAEKFLGFAPRRNGTKTCIWFHAVSVGEVNLLAPLVSEIQRQQPDWQCVISTTTATGMALARKKYGGLTVFYCPLDFTWAVAAAMRRVRPDVLALAELELWPNLIRAARRYGARVAVINGRLSEHSHQGYRRIRPLVRRVLRQIDLVAVQDETYAERFQSLGAMPDAVHVTGSMKYDGAQTDRDNPATRRLAELWGIQPRDAVFLAGSTQEPEESVALEVFRQLSPDWPALRLVLVPRHPERFPAVARLLDQSGIAWTRRTELDARVPGEGTVPIFVSTKMGLSPLARELTPRAQNPVQSPGEQANSRPPAAATAEPPRVLLVDVVGELGAWWGTAHIAFVGGSLGQRGGQNMIEPAAYGAAVSFGPNTWNFRDIVSTMLARRAAVVVADGAELGHFVRRCLEQPEYAAELGRRGRDLVLGQLGATPRTLALMSALLEGAGSGGSSLGTCPVPHLTRSMAGTTQGTILETAPQGGTGRQKARGTS